MSDHIIGICTLGWRVIWKTLMPHHVRNVLMLCLGMCQSLHRSRLVLAWVRSRPVQVTEWGQSMKVQAQTIFMGRFPLGLAQAQGGAQPGVRASSQPTTQGPDAENLNQERHKTKLHLSAYCISAQEDFVTTVWNITIFNNKHCNHQGHQILA